MSLKNLNVIKTPKQLKFKLSNKKIKKLYNFFEENFNIKEDFVVAISGGPDSLALAFLTKIYSIKNKLNPRYFIVDHKLRKDSTKEANKVVKVLKSYNIKADILTWSGKKPLQNIQSVARNKRYDLLLSSCKKLRINNLIVGHHLDDLFENFFIRMIRGSGLKGLVSLEKETKLNSINLIRPLLRFSKKDLEFISNYVFNFFVNDPSNENKAFKRIKIRSILNQFKKSGLDKDKLFLTLKNLKSSDQALKFYIEKNKKKNSFFNVGKKCLILNESFFNNPYEVVFRSFSDSLKKIGGRYHSPRGKKIDYILNKIKKNTLNKETLAGCVIKRVNQTVLINKEN
ncbi:tRNA lysidine(34) synthetase TilS [Candidatus Pelagibacter communis]|uniref:tRNA lysidine(34) synthetase TilS n=1 Tax=Pelagibacter ubique TaxID=198252 RepID=UPI00094C6BC3|nr:tRNA lysidine(34) synthetase TilS [Candidatus Pelagibacter ubique]|tara:strand:- start:3363 stop:4388 length:1026 start_codon:yes stop_codon:yes gene_type:complete